MSPITTAFRALVRKDVVAFLRDRRALVVNVMTPIAIAAFFGFVFGGGGDHDAGVSKVPVAVVDLDHSALSTDVIADLKGDATLAVEVETRGGAHARVQAGKLRAAIILPAGFGAGAPRALFAGGNKPQVELEYDPSQSLVRPMLEGILTQYVMQAVTKRMFSAGGTTEVTDDLLSGVRSNTTLGDTTRSDLVSLLEAARRFQSRPAPATGQPATGGLTVPFALQSTAVTSGPKYNAYAHSFAGMAVQFILFMGIDAGVNLLLMRELGVWRRLRAAPVSRGVLLGSRVIGTALISLLILGFVYGAAMAFFGVRISGSVPGFLAVAVAFSLLAASAGLMIAALGRSVAATRGLSMLLVLMLVMLGGAWVPTFVFPEWLQQVSAFAPTRWAVDGLDAMTWRGLPLSAAYLPVALMLGWALAFLGVAWWRFDWERD